jgi:hypothetical protein
MTGCRIEFTEEMRTAVEEWLRSEIIRFGQVAAKPEDMVTCPRCGGTLQMRGETPIFCTLCHGAMKVTTSAAVAYTASLKISASVVREQHFDEPNKPVVPSQGEMGTPAPADHFDQLRQTLASQQKPIATPVQVLSSKPVSDTIPSMPTAEPQPVVELAPPDLLPGMSRATTVRIDDDDENFVGPKPGEPGFIGPLQNT